MSHPFDKSFFLLRCRISPDLDLLEAVHVTFSWVPGRESIRPSPATMALKREAMVATRGRFDVNAWSKKFFGQPWADVLSGRGSIRPYHFAPNMFPYAVPEGTKHYILWLPSTTAMDDESVNLFLDEAVTREGGSDYVWYYNPKPTIFEIWHVQVFWH